MTRWPSTTIDASGEVGCVGGVDDVSNECLNVGWITVSSLSMQWFGDAISPAVMRPRLAAPFSAADEVGVVRRLYTACHSPGSLASTQTVWPSMPTSRSPAHRSPAGNQPLPATQNGCSLVVPIRRPATVSHITCPNRRNTSSITLTSTGPVAAQHEVADLQLLDRLRPVRRPQRRACRKTILQVQRRRQLGVPSLRRRPRAVTPAQRRRCRSAAVCPPASPTLRHPPGGPATPSCPAPGRRTRGYIRPQPDLVSL